MKAILRKSQISPKKANLIANLMHGKKVTDALAELKFLHKKAGRILQHVIKSALSNAENNFGQDKYKLFIKSILVTPGPMHRRHIPISRGRVHPIRKKTSHIAVELDILESSKTSPVSEKKSTPKKEKKLK